MQFLLINAFDCLIVSFFLYLLVNFRDRRRRGGFSYPPGPPSWPIIGNLLDVPKDRPWSAYADMSKKYGRCDVICLHVFSRVVVVLCSLSAIKDLLEKRGQTYSDRPFLPILEIMEMDWSIFNTGTTETWREGRKLLDGSLRPGAMISYRQMMQEKTREFLSQLLATPKDFHAHIELFQGKLLMSLAYGYDLKSGDKILEAPVQASKILAPLILPGAVLVNHLPFLRHIPSWVPYLSYEPLARIGRKLSERIKNEPIDFVKNALVCGDRAPSLHVESMVGSERQKQEEIVKVAVGSLYQAGSDTTVSSMNSLFLALVLFPQVQRRARAELDVVIGRDRLPTFDDRPRLPYIEALCKELMRWQMVTPIALPHSSSRDDVYRGFFIPKGSTMIANAWAILHDPEIYPDPEEFKPERFLNEDGSVRDDPALSLVFGIGKRICPGRHLVDATIFIFASSVLSVFNVAKANDENGNEIPIKSAASVQRGVIVHPEKFECSILPRDQIAEDLILANSLS
ncbi:cytochrome P450 [Russula ochroleuca]|uniref:Cytochrome P450 n=1 Tax=Russula ochroleuca TaxID=152965 RepID=A0A9P5N244_9AGAM|nr:cytochrome P450 [Russula ochroleuca]